MKKRVSLFLLTATLLTQPLLAQQKSLTNTANSRYAKWQSLDMGSVQWTTGFWAERFAVCRDSMGGARSAEPGNCNTRARVE